MRFHDELNPIIWDKDNDNQMRPEVLAKLKEIANAFIEYIEIPQDAVLDMVVTGSSASYNYNEFSDLDLHIVVDYDKIHEDCPLVEGYLGALKNTFNKEHDIFIKDVPVELYAEKKDQGTVHNGLYSVQQEEWIDRPEKIAPTDNDAAVEAKYQEIKDMVDKCDDSEQAQELLEKIYTMRKAGLAEAGEFCTENLAFKKLRNEGCMDKLRQLKKEQIDKQLSLESYNESIEDLELKEQIKQLFPWIYSTTIYNIGEVFDDRGIINLNFEIPGGRSDNEIFLWVFEDNLEIWFTNGSLGGRSSVGSLKIDTITKDNFKTKVLELLELVKPIIEEFYKKEEKEQQKRYAKPVSYDMEDDEKELYDFISMAIKSIKKKLNKEFSIHKTDNTIYINYNKKPENTVFVEPVEGSTQILKIGLLDDTNDEIDYRELDLQDFGKADIDNIINITKELFMSKNESIKESLQDEFKEAWDLLIEGTNQISMEDSDTVEKIMKKFEKLQTIKSDKIKLNKAKNLLLDITGYMIDEKFDTYCDKVYKFMNNSKNESIKEGFFTKGELTSLPNKEPIYKVGDKVKINGEEGEIIEVKSMKMSSTPTYKIKLGDKTLWRYEEEINESLRENIKENKMENLDRALFQVGKEIAGEEIDLNADAVLSRVCQLMGLPYDAADQIAWVGEAFIIWKSLLDKPHAPQYMRGLIGRESFYQYCLDKYKKQYEQAMGMDEDLATLEKKVDQAEQDLQDMIQSLKSENVNESIFDKLDNVIKRALDEEVEIDSHDFKFKIEGDVATCTSETGHSIEVGLVEEELNDKDNLEDAIAEQLDDASESIFTEEGEITGTEIVGFKYNSETKEGEFEFNIFFEAEEE